MKRIALILILTTKLTLSFTQCVIHAGYNYPLSYFGYLRAYNDDNHTAGNWGIVWKKIIIGNPAGYLDKIINTGFDGVYLDIIDSYEYFDEIAGY